MIHARIACLLAAALAAAAPFVLFCADSWAEQTTSLNASFSPKRLGVPTTISLAFRITSTPPDSQTPIRSVSLQLPSEMGIATSGLGLENCLVSRLEALGPSGCPADSLMGRGTATAEIPIGGEVVAESARVELFSAPVRSGRLALLVYADGRSPVFAQLVFPAVVVPAASPYSEGIETSVPLVPSLPGAPDVAVTRFQMALGTTSRGIGHFVYYRRSHGRRVPYAPSGLLLPPKCPRGGFPFEAHFAFEDGTTASAHTSIPCPHGSRPREHGGGAAARTSQLDIMARVR
jgi:hypothetical protein